jgi:membrane-bound lytic murein transglycosylase D
LRLYTLLSLVFIGTLSACNATMQSDQDGQNSQLEQELEQEQEHQIADQILVSCEQSKKHAQDHFDCEPAKSGTIPITHPVETDEIFVEVPEKKAEAAAEIQIKDVWQRVRNQFNFEFEDNRRIAAQRNWYLKHPNYMKRVAKRAKPFLRLIVEKLEQQDMPLELVLLPIVESAFDPFAYSHGRAAGMWQFIPSTGKRFGMKQTWWYDGRRDVMASTQGAIDYLNYLVDMYDGNWLHALAAYNSGEGRVRRAITKNKKAGKPTDFWSLDLPRETRAYVPKILALADI